MYRRIRVGGNPYYGIIYVVYLLSFTIGNQSHSWIIVEWKHCWMLKPCSNFGENSEMKKLIQLRWYIFASESDYPWKSHAIKSPSLSGKIRLYRNLRFLSKQKSLRNLIYGGVFTNFRKNFHRDVFKVTQRTLTKLPKKIPETDI